MDSMSSGHSSGSGSGSGSGNTDVIINRRRITVKPLDEPDDEGIPGYMLRSDIHICFYCSDQFKNVGRDSSVGIGTVYGLDGQEIESRWGRGFPQPPMQ
jgi:hypothetical protein